MIFPVLKSVNSIRFIFSETSSIVPAAAVDGLYMLYIQLHDLVCNNLLNIRQPTHLYARLKSNGVETSDRDKNSLL